MAYSARPPPPSRGSYRPPPRDYRNDRDHGRDRDRDRERDRDTRPRNAPSRDAYRPTSYSGRNDYALRPSAPMSYPPPPGVDNYRPPQGDFTFRMDKPAGVQDADTYRPQNSWNSHIDRRGPPSPHHDSRPAKRNRGSNDRPSARQPRDSNRFNTRYGGRPWRPFIAAERELLKTEHNTGSELAFFDTGGGVTYRNVDELSDSDEAEMDISGDEAEAEEEPSTKRARVSVEQSTSDNNAPKWSNPDPYTALPPETAPQGKKKDVVQMIRKARVQATETRSSLPSEAADFIALDFDESDSSDLEIVDEAAPAPPKATAPPPNLQLPPKPPTMSRAARAPSISPDPLSSALGSRKRTHDDEIKMPHSKFKKVTKTPAGGAIVKDWAPRHDLTPTPWLEADHSESANMAVWLHKEVVDFYDYIKPRDFEERLRIELVQDMKRFCRQVFKDAEVYPFGSFPSGLYLPTADMDMVFMSDSYASGGYGRYDNKKALYRFKSALISHKKAWENEIDLIIGAKVPLVKFIEHKTGLKVDISFENSTGLTAIDTFKAWREQYPGMPALVTLIKHFLLMRGLNEPVNGGIGGFSVICLVVSMLQLMPEVQSGNLDTRHHLGQLLLNFFDLYGNKFNYQTIAICLNPPKYIPKHQVSDFTYKDHSRLSIVDPNNPANDIAGGSSNASTVFSLFAEAHKNLRKRMAELAQNPNRQGQSILKVILGGNYSTFQEQRDYLEHLSKLPPGSRKPTGRPTSQSPPQNPSKGGRNGGSSRRRR